MTLRKDAMYELLTGWLLRRCRVFAISAGYRRVNLMAGAITPLAS